MFESGNINTHRPFIDRLPPPQPNKDVSVEKSLKADEEDGAKPKLSDTRKVNRKKKKKTERLLIARRMATRQQ